MSNSERIMTFFIYRFDPEQDKKPFMQEYSVNTEEFEGKMLLNAIEHIKETQDPSLVAMVWHVSINWLICQTR